MSSAVHGHCRRGGRNASEGRSRASLGIQPTFRHTMLQRGVALDDHHIQAEVSSAEGG